MAHPKPFLPRFEKRTIPEPNSGCLIWLAGCTKQGRPEMSFKGMHAYVSRLAYEHFVGPVPSFLSVLHHCDNPFCVNSDHLFLGTQRDNMMQMLKNNRQAKRVNGKYWRGT